jgi:hypothetical protein
VIFFTHIITSRLNYVLEFIAGEISNKPFIITSDPEQFRQAENPKFNYTGERITNQEFRIRPQGLLFENNIREQKIDCFNSGERLAFFKTDGDYPFDIFAAVFYLLSRYEEYLPHQKDIYGRYAHENSLAFRKNFLHIPLINYWLQDFKKSIQKQFPSFAFRQSSFIYQPTYDVDEAYCFKYKDWKRSAGGAIKSLMKGEVQNFVTRRKVLNGLVPDPFDAYGWLDSLHTTYRLKPVYFFLVAAKNGKYDKNILPGERALQNLINAVASKYEIGVHPSWQSGDEPALIRKETETVEKITKLKIISSRQHFIRFTLPGTFRDLAEAGIKKDYSMGYGSINGFRASVATPFYWYDLEKNQTSYLKLYPFCYMEANSYYEQKMSPEKALEELIFYYQAVKKVGGTMITIWHNTFLGSDPRFKGWKETYERFIGEVAHHNL